ncbi:hypothetical protein B0T19DRAFT_296306 [Cercophora scortea]|uniref:Uncharacterized protein n=1 Tax=Cercophora scortea TaxID=314031 RepID=A0AAE0M373_9PEZI|nr:hypothetical protein B0T19DRAFT_296306 [Cercophora scortea]
MLSKIVLIAALLAGVDARFGKEGAAQQGIQDLGNQFGSPGVAATLAGQSPGVLLAGANACAKLILADKIVTELGNDPKVIAVAAALVAAEKNFNPFAVSIPSICSDASLPATAALRGIVPLVDPAVTGSDVENANSAKSLVTPFSANGLSVADVMAANGFTNFTLQAADGSAGGAAKAGNANAGKGNAATTAAATTAAAAATSAAAVATSAVASCVPVTLTTTVKAAASTAAATSAAAAATSAAAVVSGNTGSAVAAGVDFGLCVPTIKFEAGLNGRKATEFTFQAIDPLVNKGQQEALNPNIITNRICDQLGNVCKANQAAKDACLAAKAQILALGTRDKTTADAWNTALGFPGTNTNPDNAPKAGLVGHT